MLRFILQSVIVHFDANNIRTGYILVGPPPTRVHIETVPDQETIFDVARSTDISEELAEQVFNAFISYMDTCVSNGARPVLGDSLYIEN